MEKKQPDRATVRSVTNRIVHKLDQSLETPSGKAMLANLRNSIGKPLTESIAIWPLLFDHLPEEFLSRGPALSKKEIAILSTLQLYALYRQGKKAPVSQGAKEEKPPNIGRSLNALRTGDNTVSTDRRFNALVTAATYDEFSHHLRQMINLLKSKTSGETDIDFGKLAQDLYGFLTGKDESIRLNWARAYYRSYSKGGKENDQQ
ncbi:MAG TPA: type I-E CRISPR-associated protein Cse2/CasB [Clostridia bacterium]|jgi:CRISPR system Cascade subunit CasB|nr:type I-E CRISPR-associated protein Cse2/CasB [Clostridia bacterium]HQA97302.1 type I-E CRISPR-associated protein Cse2/CasB [Clostridia bacterium]HQO54969.1 type I-E CRISPR-associated protein Cse2/CasB [Clostridia bacterium]